MRSRSVVRPIPFAAETCTDCGSSRRLSRCFDGSRSTLFLTCKVGLLAALGFFLQHFLNLCILFGGKRAAGVGNVQNQSRTLNFFQRGSE